MRSTEEVVRNLCGGPFRIKRDPMCRWCSRSVSKGSICNRCERWSSDPEREKRWEQLRYARVEVLTPAAAEIARKFSLKAQREDFDFTPVLREESRQMVLVAGWVQEKRYYYVERANGQWLQLHEICEVPVLFSLLPRLNWRESRRTSTVSAKIAAFELWWRKAIRIAKGAPRCA